MRDGKRSGWYCRPCAASKAAAYRKAEPDRVLDSRLWCYYRIRLADWQRMLDEQGGRCKACRQVPTGNNGFAGTAFVIDHDHTCCAGSRHRWGATATRREPICGECIRGLLCQGCNVALGMVDDDLDRLRALIEYVEAHRGSKPA